MHKLGRQTLIAGKMWLSYVAAIVIQILLHEALLAAAGY